MPVYPLVIQAFSGKKNTNRLPARIIRVQGVFLIMK